MEKNQSLIKCLALMMKNFQPDMRVSAFRPPWRTWEYTATHAAVSITFLLYQKQHQIAILFYNIFCFLTACLSCIKKPNRLQTAHRSTAFSFTQSLPLPKSCNWKVEFKKWKRLFTFAAKYVRIKR